MSQVNNRSKDPQGDEISLKELILKARELFRYLLRQWKLIVLAGVVGGALGLVYSLVKKPIYLANLSFVMEEEKSGGALGAYAGIASQFGLNLGDLSGGGIFEGDNIMEFIRSRAMIGKTLLTKARFEAGEDLLVNRYIAYNKLRKGWKDERLKTLEFRDTSGVYLQDSLMGLFYKAILKTNLTVEKPDKKLSIIQVSFESKDELFSKLFVETLMENVSAFYTQTRTKKSQDNLAVLNKQVDSVRRELNNAIGGVAAASEGSPNANVAFQRLKVPSQRRTIDVQANTAILTELVKNQELAKITLRNDKPLIQVLDRPILPLEKEKVGKAKGIVIGGILAGFLICLYLIAKKLYQQIMQ